MKKLFAAASGIFAVIPGVIIITNNLGVPPNISKYIYSGTTEALGVLTILLLFLNKNKIKNTLNKIIINRCIFAVVLFIMCLFTYIFLYGLLVVSPSGNNRSVFFPLWASGELATGLIKYGSKMALIDEWGIDGVSNAIASSSSINLMMTTCLLLLIYQFVFVPLVFAFGIIGIKLDDTGTL